MFTIKKEMTYVRDAVISLFAKLQLRYNMFWLMFLTILKNKTGYLCQNSLLIVYGSFERDFFVCFFRPSNNLCLFSECAVLPMDSK